MQVAAVSKDQTRNTFKLFPGLFAKDCLAEHGIDLGKQIIYSARGGAIEAVTSSPRSLEGGRSSFVVKAETQHWLRNNDGHEMAEVISRNVTKARDGAARALAISNAHSPGEESDAERDYEAWLAIEQGRSKAKAFLYDSLEAPPDTDLADADSLKQGLRIARGDSVWLDIDRTADAVWDTRTPPSISRRYYLNQVAAAEDAWVAPHEWDACQVDDELQPGDRIALGFDGSRSNDSTALVACRISDGLLDLLDVWEKPDLQDDWSVPRDEVDAAVARAFDRYEVVAFFSDVHPWETYVDEWGHRYGDQLTANASRRHSVAFDMRNRTREFTQAAEKTLQEIVDRTLRHTGHDVLSRHAKNARRRPNRWGVSFGKEHRESTKKVDALAAAVLARIARDAVLYGNNQSISGKKPSTQWVAY